MGLWELNTVTCTNTHVTTDSARDLGDDLNGNRPWNK